MFLPILHYDDGYGFTYGDAHQLRRSARAAQPHLGAADAGAASARPACRSSARSSWGRSSASPASSASAARENPHYEIGDTRIVVQRPRRGRRAALAALRRGRRRGRRRVRRRRRPVSRPSAADVTIDTRVDPAFPRNAVHATFGWERLQFDAGQANRNTVDARGYLGLFGGTVLARARAVDHVGSAAAGLRAQPAGRRRRTCAASTPATRPTTTSRPRRPSCAFR